MRIDIVTLFPDMVEPALGASMLGRARQRGLVDIRVANLRDYAEGKHRVTDDYPFGGGGGMILKPEPLFAAVEALRTPDARVILMDPRGRRCCSPATTRASRSGDGRRRCIARGGRDRSCSSGQDSAPRSASWWNGSSGATRPSSERERDDVMDAIRLVEAGQLKKDRSSFAPGDTV